MAQKDGSMRVEPRKIGRISTGDGTRYGLPADLLETAVKRLGFLGLIIALMAPASYFIERIIQPQRVVLKEGIPFPQIVAAGLFAIGVSVCVLAWSRVLRPELMLDLGLGFEVIVAFAIALSENATPWPEDQEIRGISWNCLWISMYVVAIPGTYGKSVMAALLAACMAAFGLLVATVANDNPLPGAGRVAVLVLLPFVVAAWTIPVGRHLYRLGAQVNKARAMGSYELIDLIGRGGMGEVWTARHRMLARVSAIKLIRPETLGLDDPDHMSMVLRRFEREARATAALRSPHTIVLYDYGLSQEGNFYYVMELLDGLDLETLVERFGPQPAGRVVSFLQQAAKSLAEAHQQGLVHRDIKPRNIFSCRMGTDYDFVKVLDFGLVKVSSTSGSTDSGALTQSGVAAGTPGYMAPEVAMASSSVDGRADLYSLGCVGYRLLTGQMVFEGANAVAIALAHVGTPPMPPSQRTEMPVPFSLERVILQCLEKDPALRPQTALELNQLLAGCEDVEPWTQKEAAQWWEMHMPAAMDATAVAFANADTRSSG